MTRPARVRSGLAADAIDAIYAVVTAIPAGRVATYGQVAEMAGLPRRARLVGYALGRLPDGDDIPWHRVVNAAGGISPRSVRGDSERDQRRLLEAEGVVFRGPGRIDLSAFQWEPEDEG